MSRPIVQRIAAGQAWGQHARPREHRPLAETIARGAFADLRRSGHGVAEWIRSGDVGHPEPAPIAAPGPQTAPCPAVSVIVPCRNGAETLPVALTSLRRQSFRNWEAIVIDDGSTDATPAALRAWSARDQRIKALCAGGLGVAAARNLGLAAARAPWVLFLDCDDWLHPKALERLSAAARRAPEAGVIAGATVKVCPGGRREKLPHFDLTDAFAALCCEGRIAIHSALVRAERVRDVRGFDQSLGTNEDWDLWQRLARTGVTFVQIPKVVAFYRNTPGSLSKDPLRVARDGLAVMRRGHGPDPRIVAVPALAMGAPADAYPCRAHYFALWCGARLIAQGGDGAAVASLLPPGGCDAEPLSLGALIASGMADVLGQPERALGSRWAEFEPKLTDLLALLGPQRARQQGLTLAVIKARLNAGAVDPGRLEMARDPRALPSTQIVQLTWKGRSLGAVAMPSLAPRGASLVEAAAAQARRLPLREGIRASDAWRSPSFWTATLAGLASRSAAGLLLDPPQLRPVLRQALADGVAAMVRARLRRRAADAPDAHQQALAERAAAACADAARFARSLNEPPPRAPARSGAAQPRVGTGARSVPVLMYHRIANDPVPGLERYCLAPERFEAQLRWLRAEGYSPVTPAEVLNFMRCQAGLPARPVMLTFDDGYIDFCQNAWPRLRRFGMSAVVYAVTGLVGGRAVWDAGAGVPAALMDWGQLRTLSEQGIAVESHGHSHRHMSRLPTEALYDEALRSRALLEKVLGQAPASFCYPYGAHDPAAERVLEECGYRLAFTTREGVCSLAEEPLRAPRIEVAAADDLSVFRRKLSDASQR